MAKIRGKFSICSKINYDGDVETSFTFDGNPILIGSSLVAKMQQDHLLPRFIEAILITYQTVPKEANIDQIAEKLKEVLEGKN